MVKGYADVFQDFSVTVQMIHNVLRNSMVQVLKVICRTCIWLPPSCGKTLLCLIIVVFPNVTSSYNGQQGI